MEMLVSVMYVRATRQFLYKGASVSSQMGGSDRYKKIAHNQRSSLAHDMATWARELRMQEEHKKVRLYALKLIQY
jgi:hypothetical protein